MGTRHRFHIICNVRGRRREEGYLLAPASVLRPLLLRAGRPPHAQSARRIRGRGVGGRLHQVGDDDDEDDDDDDDDGDGVRPPSSPRGFRSSSRDDPRARSDDDDDDDDEDEKLVVVVVDAGGGAGIHRAAFDDHPTPAVPPGVAAPVAPDPSHAPGHVVVRGRWHHRWGQRRRSTRGQPREREQQQRQSEFGGNVGVRFGRHGHRHDDGRDAESRRRHCRRGGRGRHLSAGSSGGKGGRGGGGAVDYEPPTNRRRRAVTIHLDTSPPTSFSPPSFRASAGAASAAAASAASSASPSTPDGGLFSHRHNRHPAGVLPPPSRFAASASAPTFGGLGGHGGNFNLYPHSSGSFHTEDCSESDSGCGSPLDVVGMGAQAFGGAGGGWAAGAGIHRGTTTAAGGMLATMNGAAAASAHAGGSSTARHATNASLDVAASPSSSAAGRGGHQHHRPVDKRQRRLERNRESARVSRRRRKHYLEELECRVSGLSEEMDRGRMDHAKSAVRAVRGMRSAVLDDAEGLLLTGHGLPTDDRDRRLGGDGATTNGAGPLPLVKKSSGIHHNVVVARNNANDHQRHPIGGDGGSFASSQRPASASAKTAASTSSLLLERAANALVTHLSRTSTELQVVQTFMKQHLLSLVQPTPTRFALWLSLQDDGFYRGGRSASERLSAARIGERVSCGDVRRNGLSRGGQRGADARLIMFYFARIRTLTSSFSLSCSRSPACSSLSRSCCTAAPIAPCRTPP